MIKWCVIGAGGIADRRTIPGILADKNCTLVGVMDRNAETARRVGEKYGVPYFTNEDEMLSACHADAVYIGTPVFMHYKQAMQALSHGVNVLLEKPICLSAKEGEALVSAFKAAGLLLMVGYMMKYHNLHQKARKIVADGGIGQVSGIGMHLTGWYPDIPGAWRQQKALGGGGAVMDLAVHCIDLAEYILNDEITEVKSFYNTQTFSYEVDDSATVLFRTKRGVQGYIVSNFNVPDAAACNTVHLYGTGGCIRCSGTLGQVEGGMLAWTPVRQDAYDAQQSGVSAKQRRFYGRHGNLYTKQIREFCKQLRKSKTDCRSGERAVAVQKITEAVYADDNKQ